MKPPKHRALYSNKSKPRFALDTASVEAVQLGRAANPTNVKRVERILSSTDWQTLFAMRDASYTYTRFLQAIAKIPAVCDDYSDGLQCRCDLP